MAVKGTITRSRKDDFVEVTNEEDDLRQFVENANSGDTVTIHSGDFTTSTVSGGKIEIPSGVVVVILPGANVETDTSKSPQQGGNFPTYPIFSGNTENLVDFNTLSSDLFLDRVEFVIGSGIEVDFQSIVVDDTGSNPTLSVNEDGNSKVKLGKLSKNRIPYIKSSDGELTTSSDLRYDVTNDVFTVRADQNFTGDMTLDGSIDFTDGATDGPLAVNNLSTNKIVATNSSKELETYNNLSFDGTNLSIGSSANLLYNKSSANADIHFKPSDGLLIESGNTSSSLTLNESSPFSNRALHITQGDKDVGIYLETSDSSTDVFRIRNSDQTSDIVQVLADRTVSLANVEADSISTSSGFVNVDSNDDETFAGISTGAGVDIRYNKTISEWEFTNDGNNYTSFIDIPTYEHATEDRTISSGSLVTLDVSNIFSSGVTTDQVSLRSYVLDQSGSATNGQYIDAVGIVTVVRKFNDTDSNNTEYVIYNEHPNQQEFRFVLRRYE